MTSTIATLTTRYRELGRLRMGAKVNGRRPTKLETWRFTSTDQRLIQRAAHLYGGTPEPWADAPSGTRQWQVVTDHDSIPVIIPPPDEQGNLVGISQAMEAWTAAGCVRRCDGQVEYVSGAECLCQSDPDEATCRPTTRLSVLLPEMPGLGVWRLETHGWFAARELVPMVRMAATLGGNQTYRLRIDPRHMDSRDPGGKPQTFHFGVPVLDTDLTPAQLFDLAASTGTPALQDTSGPVGELPAPTVSPTGSEVANHDGTKPGDGPPTVATSPPGEAAAPSPGRRPPGGQASAPAGGSTTAGEDRDASKGKAGEAATLPGGPNTPPATSPVTLWALGKGLVLSRVLAHLRREHADDFGDLRSVSDLYALSGEPAEKAIAYLKAAFEGQEGSNKDSRKGT